MVILSASLTSKAAAATIASWPSSCNRVQFLDRQALASSKTQYPFGYAFVFICVQVEKLKDVWEGKCWGLK